MLTRHRPLALFICLGLVLLAGCARGTTPGLAFNGVYGIVSLVLLVLDILAIIRIVQSGASALAKLIWIIVILVMPVVGLLLWLLLGPGKKA